MPNKQGRSPDRERRPSPGMEFCLEIVQMCSLSYLISLLFQATTGRPSFAVFRSGKKETAKVHLLEAHPAVQDEKELPHQSGYDGRHRGHPHGHNHRIGQEEVLLLLIGEEVHLDILHTEDAARSAQEVHQEEERHPEAEARLEVEALLDGDPHPQNGTDIDFLVDHHHDMGLHKHIGIIEDHHLLMKVSETFVLILMNALVSVSFNF